MRKHVKRHLGGYTTGKSEHLEDCALKSEMRSKLYMIDRELLAAPFSAARLPQSTDSKLDMHGACHAFYHSSKNNLCRRTKIIGI